ncbi:MBL fold metallo-hydrolase [Arenibaculum pallidiluteum]|uniref:MBL fold metallo-hydrolase n=1 Tax=Arenibaculum pallidiluteum TaxID=2812559 RepID=UPI001A95C720|nr:MBL fold metallo-hydrolase [Arenibaculum pallidiluteum]
MPVIVEAFFDKPTSTLSYVVFDGDGGSAAIIDPVLGFDYASGRTSTAFADGIAAFVRARRLSVAWILETHVHADHLSAAAYLRKELGGTVGIGRRVVEVQKRFAGVYAMPPEFRQDGGQFDHLFRDGETFRVGSAEGRVIATPGHTPDSVSYYIGDAVFVGDTLFMPDGGTARCDFPGGSAHELYGSIRRLLALPPETRMFVCHDYQPNGREIAWQTTVAAQRSANIHTHDGISEDQFVAMRTERDRTLGMPALIIPSIQVNIEAGQLPKPDDNGLRYLKLPLDGL